MVGVGLGLDVAGHVVDEFAFLENHMNKAGRVLARPICGEELEIQTVFAQRVGLEQKRKMRKQSDKALAAAAGPWLIWYLVVAWASL